MTLEQIRNIPSYENDSLTSTENLGTNKVKELILSCDVIVFDVDGTLYFNGPDMRSLHQKLYAEKLWLTVPAIQARYATNIEWEQAFISAVNPVKSKKRSLGEALTSLNLNLPPEFKDAAKDYADIGKSAGLSENAGLVEMLKNLREQGKKLYVITAAAEEGTKVKLAKILGPEYVTLVDQVWTSQDGMIKKNGEAYLKLQAYLTETMGEGIKICVVSNSFEKDLATAVGKGASVLVHLSEDSALADQDTGVTTKPSLGEYQGIPLVTMGEIGQLVTILNE